MNKEVWIADFPERGSVTDLKETVALSEGYEYVLLNISRHPYVLLPNALTRFVAAARTGADMVYSDRFVEGKEYFERLSQAEAALPVFPDRHPVIDCQEGSLRDDFDFGQLVLFDRNAMCRAVDILDGLYPDDLRFGAFYALRLRMRKIVHLNECLYIERQENYVSGHKAEPGTYEGKSADENDRKEAQFNYVDPVNREIQIEMEQICKDYLKETGAFISADSLKTIDYELTCSGYPDWEQYGRQVLVSVVIPVFNRVQTIDSALVSALSQKCGFPFNVIVVDNHSFDGTREKLEKYSLSHSNLLVMEPDSFTHGIGGCWNLAVNSSECGLFAVQLDSDDRYADENVLERIVREFVNSKAAMVVGSYTLTDETGRIIPPGLIDHREWTAENGHNNALRINGLGAPRCFYVPVLHEIGGFPDVSYGEDYAVAIRIAREYRIGRIFESLYNCQRWAGNSDAKITPERLNANNFYKDKIRTLELAMRKHTGGYGKE